MATPRRLKNKRRGRVLWFLRWVQSLMRCCHSNPGFRESRRLVMACIGLWEKSWLCKVLIRFQSTESYVDTILWTKIFGVAGSSYEPITESHETSFGTLRKHVPIKQRQIFLCCLNFFQPLPKPGSNTSEGLGVNAGVDVRRPLARAKQH